MADLNLSVQCSFQLILVLNAPVSTSKLTPGLAIQSVQEALRQPIPAECTMCKEAHTFNLPLYRDDFEQDSSCWTIEADDAAFPTAEEVLASGSIDQGTKLFGVKLISRKIQMGRRLRTMRSIEYPSHMHSLGYQTEISAVLDHLRATFEVKSGQKDIAAFLYASESCRMTVEIDGDVQMPTFDRVDRIIDVCGRQLDGLQRGKAFGKSSPWLSLIEEDSPPDHDSKFEEPMCERNPFDTTISFGQGVSTLDSTVAMAWIDVLICMVIRAERAEKSFFEYQIGPQGELSAPLFSSTDLLKSFGCSPNTIDVYAKISAGHNAHLKDVVAAAMVAAANELPLSSFALHVANSALVEADPLETRLRIKLKLLSGEYGRFSRKYTRLVLDALDKDKEGEVIQLVRNEGVPAWAYEHLPEELKVGLCK